MLDGLFHAGTYIFTAVGLLILWQTARRPHFWWSPKLLVATMLMGFGIFNVVEGIVDHHILGLHHVNETVSPEQWVYWDMGFLTWGAAMIAVSWFVWLRQANLATLPTEFQPTRYPAPPIPGSGHRPVSRRIRHSSGTPASSRGCSRRHQVARSPAGACRRARGAVAFVTGRNVDRVDRLFAPLHLPTAGLDGLEHRLTP